MTSLAVESLPHIGALLRYWREDVPPEAGPGEGDALPLPGDMPLGIHPLPVPHGSLQPRGPPSESDKKSGQYPLPTDPGAWLPKPPESAANSAALLSDSKASSPFLMDSRFLSRLLIGFLFPVSHPHPNSG